MEWIYLRTQVVFSAGSSATRNMCCCGLLLLSNWAVLGLHPWAVIHRLSIAWKIDRSPHASPARSRQTKGTELHKSDLAKGPDYPTKHRNFCTSCSRFLYSFRCLRLVRDWFRSGRPQMHAEGAHRRLEQECVSLPSFTSFFQNGFSRISFSRMLY